MKLELEVTGPVPAPVDKIVNLARDDDDVMAVALYGSYVRGEYSGISDLDVCIFLIPRARQLERMHEKRMKYTEVAANDKIDVQVFHLLPLPVRSTILKDAKMVLVKDESAIYELAFETIKDWEAFRKHYDEYLHGIENAESR